eukprot:COSAG02_NODE_2837_length_7921_cov_9.013552_2_plen_816_part_00
MQRLAVRNQEKKTAALVDKLFRRLEHRDSDSDDEDDDGLHTHYDRARGARSLYQQHKQQLLQQQQQQQQQTDGAQQDEWEESMVVPKDKAVASRMQLAREEMAAAWQHTVAPPPTLSALVTASAGARTLAQRQIQSRVVLPPMPVATQAAKLEDCDARPNSASAPGSNEHDAMLTPWTQNGAVVKTTMQLDDESQQRGPKRAAQNSARLAFARPASARPSSASSAGSAGSADVQPQPPREKRHRATQRRVMSARPALQRPESHNRKETRQPLKPRSRNGTRPAPPAYRKQQQKIPKTKVRQQLTAGGRIDTGRKGEDLGKKMELKRLQRVWKRVDADGSGTLDHDEVRAIFVEMGKTLSNREFLRAMDQIDADGSGEVDFKEFVDYWDRTMTAAGVVVPSTFKFRNLCVRAVLKAEAEGGRGEHHWIADDIENILFSLDNQGGKRKPGELFGEQAKLLQDLWTAFDADGNGTLEQDEVQKVIEAAMERTLTDKELKIAFEAMDDDGSGGIDFHEFTRWWVNQGDDVKNRVMRKAFEETMASLGSEDISRVVIDTAEGPELVRLVSPRGLFRLVIRSKSGHCREFHEWVQTLSVATRKERGQRRKCVFHEPDAMDLTKDFVMKNILVTTKNKDGWLFHKSEAVGVKSSDVRSQGCEVKVFTMPSPLPHKPNMLCVKGYTVIDGVTPAEVDRRLWEPSTLTQWNLLAGDLRIVKTIDGGDARITHCKWLRACTSCLCYRFTVRNADSIACVQHFTTSSSHTIPRQSPLRNLCSPTHGVSTQTASSFTRRPRDLTMEPSSQEGGRRKMWRRERCTVQA